MYMHCMKNSHDFALQVLLRQPSDIALQMTTAYNITAQASLRTQKNKRVAYCFLIQDQGRVLVPTTMFYSVAFK